MNSTAHMSLPRRAAFRCLVGCSLLALLCSAAVAQGGRKTAQGWTIEEACEQLSLNPRDPFLQYVALQLARRSGEQKWLNRVHQLVAGGSAGRGRLEQPRVDLFNLFSGALAVQESLQLEAMRTGSRPVADTAEIDVTTLSGPTLRGHPWAKMLQGKTPTISLLAKSVPYDQYFVLFHSLEKLLQATEVGHDWGMHLFQQAQQDSRKQHLSGSMKKQLAIETHKLARPFYQMVVAEVALTGNDLYFREGNDVTLLFRLKKPKIFRARMDAYLDNAEKAHADSRRSKGKYLGVPFVHLSAADREVHVFSAWPADDLHVRSNSRLGLERVLEAIRGKKPDGTPVERLGDSLEYRYIRTLMPSGAPEEDGFVYLSDPFIRRLVGPVIKLTEKRRLVCFNHMQMIGHAALLFATEQGRWPRSLKEIATAHCSPYEFGSDAIACPDGGRYSFKAEYATGVCSRHGRPGRLVPCAEIPVTRITRQEANEYAAFRLNYDQYWRRYFDPIAVRIDIEPKRHRLETIILPLIDNSVYTGLSQLLAGAPALLGKKPLPNRTIFSLFLKWRDAGLLGKNSGSWASMFLPDASQIGFKFDQALAERTMTHGLGRQIGLHVYDASPMFDYRLTEAMGEMMAVGGAVGAERRVDQALDGLMLGSLIASLNAPVFLDIDVKDPEIVDGFLDHFDALLARVARQRNPGRSFFSIDYDFTKLPILGSHRLMRCFTMNLMPLKIRVFWARIGRRLVIASRRYIVDDLASLGDGRGRKPVTAKYNASAGGGAKTHAMVRIYAKNWKRVLPDYRLGWADNQRRACLNNLGALTSLARPILALRDSATTTAKDHATAVLDLAEKLYRQRLICPDAGRYVFAADGSSVRCSIHHTAANPRQLTAPAAQSRAGRMLAELFGVTAEITFLEDGLRAVLTVERK